MKIIFSKQLYFFLFILLIGKSSFNQQILIGNGVVAIASPDSVYSGFSAANETLEKQNWLNTMLPGYATQNYFSLYVFTCIKDSGNFFKVIAPIHTYDENGDYIKDTLQQIYIKKNKYSELVSWEKYLVGKNIYGFKGDPKYVDMKTKATINCKQTDCLVVKKISGIYAEVAEPEFSDCKINTKNCMKNGFVIWRDNNFLLLKIK